MNGKPIVFVVDDDPSVRKAIALLVDSAGWHAETFPSACEFLCHPRPAGPSCLVVDVTLPDLDGFEVQSRVAADRVDMPVIFISGYGSVPLTVRAMKGGAIEFLTKPLGSDALLTAVADAIERSAAILDQQDALRLLRTCHASLTRREGEVLALVVSGCLNKQIGAELEISEITVKAHRGSMMRKMKAASVPHLAHMAARLGIAPDDAASVCRRMKRTTGNEVSRCR
jgi:FixJ family two-component response regulator